MAIGLHRFAPYTNPMTVRHHVLAVTPTARLGDQILQWLTAAGYSVQVLTDFATAKAELDSHPPDLLIAEVRLGAYNGLHLAIRAGAKGPGTPAIVIGGDDAVLEAEAEQHRVTYVKPPLHEARLVGMVRELLAAHRAARRFPRKRVGKLDASVDGVSAQVVEVSYEGVRVEVAHADALPLYFTVHVPTFDVTCRVRRVWTKRAPNADGSIWCGAALATGDAAAAVAWRSLVDAMPGLTVVAN